MPPVAMRSTSIELGDRLVTGDSEQIEVLGFVTDIVAAFEFTVGNQVVQFNATTLFVDGTPDGYFARSKTRG